MTAPGHIRRRRNVGAIAPGQRQVAAGLAFPDPHAWLDDLPALAGVTRLVA